ncbi:MAG: transporter substrate-binding domain-containing protein, partial [Propionibacteriaceae bacterium]|nr:transporter substrate-binding domain-containing protein [Propionibacteriaceae bacterium]
MKTKHVILAPLIVLSIALMAAGCSSSTPTSNSSDTQSGNAGTFNSGNPTYDAIINGGAVADDATINANAWASAVKKAGTLRVGATQTSTLFSLLDPATDKLVGFDAGLSQLLSRYILGDAKTDVTVITTPTREQVLTSNSVDVVFATYSITAARMEQINFAGPYYQSQAGILVAASNTSINSVADLAGKKVATQANSTGITLLQNEAPDATVVELPDNAQCLAAVQQGQVDAYVIDQAILLNALVSNNDVKLVGDPF